MTALEKSIVDCEKLRENPSTRYESKIRKTSFHSSTDRGATLLWQWSFEVHIWTGSKMHHPNEFFELSCIVIQCCRRLRRDETFSYKSWQMWPQIWWHIHSEWIAVHVYRWWGNFFKCWWNGWQQRPRELKCLSLIKSFVSQSSFNKKLSTRRKAVKISLIKSCQSILVTASSVRFSIYSKCYVSKMNFNLLGL